MGPTLAASKVVKSHGGSYISAARSTQVLRPSDLVQNTQSQTNLPVGTKSPSKRVTKKLSHKIQAAGYTAEISNATKKILLSSGLSHPDHGSKVLKGHSQSSGIKKLQLTKPEVADKQKAQNIQLLRQVHHKQITTASKGKDSGSVQISGQGKSFSVLVPSAESVALSKAMLLDCNSGQPSAVKDDTLSKRASAANSVKKKSAGGSLILHQDDHHTMMQDQPNDKQTDDSADPTVLEHDPVFASKKTSFVSARFSVS